MAEIWQEIVKLAIIKKSKKYTHSPTLPIMQNYY